MKHSIAHESITISGYDTNLFNFFASFIRVAKISKLVWLPLTISKRRITFAGLKKCVPTTSVGLLVAFAISSISRVEVLEARIAPSLAKESILLKISF